MADHVIASTDELDDCDRMAVELEGREIGVFCIEGECLPHARSKLASYPAHTKGGNVVVSL